MDKDTSSMTVPLTSLSHGGGCGCKLAPAVLSRYAGDYNAGPLGILKVTSDGSTLWHSGIGRVGNSPSTYELDGRQYFLVAGGGVLYAWTLPEKK
jgi:hypothetical protein